MDRRIQTSDVLDVAYSPLQTRLSNFSAIDDADLAALDHLKHVQRDYQKGQLIASRGDRLSKVVLVVSGWVARSRILKSGSRQIVHILLPGDLSGDIITSTRMDHELEPLTDCTVRLINPSDLTKVLRRAPGLGTALWWASEQEEGMLRETIVRLGRRSAIERSAHLFLELHRRLHLVEQASDDTFILPISQAVLGDVLGLSLVHINKTLRKLEQANLIERHQSVIKIVDIESLAEICDFDLVHFHLDAQKIRDTTG